MEKSLNTHLHFSVESYNAPANPMTFIFFLNNPGQISIIYRTHFHLQPKKKKLCKNNTKSHIHTRTHTSNRKKNQIQIRQTFDCVATKQKHLPAQK